MGQSGSEGLKLPELKDLVNKDTQCIFDYYQEGCLWYCVEDKRSTKHLFQFPIDVLSENPSGAFESCVDSVILMRWIRKHLEYLKKSYEEQNQS